MAKSASNWKFTFDPTGTARVLLDFGQKIEGDVRFGMTMGAEVVPIEGADDFIRALVRKTINLSFEVYQDAASDQLARRAVMESLIAIGPLVKKPLRVHASGVSDRYWQFANSYITEHNAGRHLPAPFARLVKGYTIICTGLTQVGP